ncbi:hypothetical protein AB0F15_34110 [Amycolatopsis sp. NPDC026612]|uniref:hypothetical protein n=1 Tax=Amycolatopsis sp. NPDC026612 TaxID=3155466 RepID=UPI0033ECAC85
MPIVESITTSFSAAGARILLAPWPTTEVCSAPGARELVAACEAVRALGRDTVVADLVPAAPSPAEAAIRLAAPKKQTPHGADASKQATDRTRADLIITVLPPHHEDDGSVETVAIAAAGRLVFGGVLAVYTHSDWSSGRLIDRSGAMIAAAQNADLLYLQHIVTLHTAIRNGRLQPPQADGPVRDDADRRAWKPGSPTPHTRVHGDVLVFAQAHADTADLR